MLTEKDFRGEINIPNAHEGAVCEALCKFIAQYEPQFLDAVLGIGLATAFLSAIAVIPVAAPYDFLLNGGTYTDLTGTMQRWEGIRYSCARFVYWHWLRDLASLTTTTGVVVPVNENSERYGGMQKQVTAWNQMLDSVQRMRYLLRNYNTAGTLLFTQTGLPSPRWDYRAYQNTFGI